MEFTVARLSSHTYNVGDIIPFQKKTVMTAEGYRTRFYAYDKDRNLPFGILENSRFHTLPQTQVMETSLAATMPDTIHVEVLEVTSIFGGVKVRYNP